VRATEPSDFAGRIPNYAKFKDEITQVYIEKVKKKKYTILFYLSVKQ
jgi:hypothetical protein